MANLIETYQYYLDLNNKKFNEENILFKSEEDLVNLIKSEIQFNCLLNYKKNNFKGVAMLATGAGKTRIGCIAGSRFIQQNNNETTLISVPTEILRDTEWPNELKKWGFEDCLSNITIECHATSRNRKKCHFNTLIIDEAHHILSTENIKLLTLNTFDRILLLSATLSKNNLIYIEKLKIPIIYEYTLEQGIQDNIINAPKRYIFNVELDIYERKQYNHITSEISNIGFRIKELLGITNNISVESIIKLYGSNNSEISMLAKIYMKEVSKRKAIINNSVNKNKIIINLCKIIKKEQIIIFCETIKTTDLLFESIEESVNYHSKLKKSTLKFKDQRSINLNAFRENKARILVAAKAIDEGTNIPSVSYAMIHTSTSSNRQKIQREGRVLRYEKSKNPIIINLCCINTIEENWIYKSYGNKKMYETINTIEEFITKTKL